MGKPGRKPKRPERMYKLYNRETGKFHKKYGGKGQLYRQVKHCANAADARETPIDSYEIVCYDIVEVHRVPLIEYLRNKEAGKKIV